MTNKKYGRVGDAPIIGAGTYADKNVGISGTGWENFTSEHLLPEQLLLSMNIKTKMWKTTTQEVMLEIEKLGGDGGMIS